MNAQGLRYIPFMLSKWRKQVRDGALVADPPPLEPQEATELQRLRDVERQFRRLQMEQELRKKAFRFASERKMKCSPSSRQTGKRAGHLHVGPHQAYSSTSTQERTP